MTRGVAPVLSRSPISFPKRRTSGSIEAALLRSETLALFKNILPYVYRRDFLLKFASWPPSALEQTERLEQLRALERGARIIVVAAASESIGVDTVQDLQRVRELMATGYVPEQADEATISR